MSLSRPPTLGLCDAAHERDSCGVGFIAHVKGLASRGIVRDALTALERMSHRSARGADPDTGDGAGVLVALPDGFFRAAVERELGCGLPAPGRYAIGMVFLPADGEQRQVCRTIMERFIRAHGQRLLGWRPVPTNSGAVGATARATEPVVEQFVIEAADGLDQAAFERQLYLIRKQAYHTVRACALSQRDYYHVCSLSSRVIVYKGQLTPGQLPRYYTDLADEGFASHAAMFHARFSTNTFPSWSRAQPLRFVGHNGEINTLRGNINWMRAREGLLRSELFGAELEKLYPIIDPETSDSGIFDNVLELLCMAGRSLPEALMMMVPAAWDHDDAMAPADRAFYEYHASLLEPWDGPALVTFTDGRMIGAVLDRNGLRPSRYYVLDDDRVIMASEVGVLDVPADRILHKGRLEPGRMFLIDFERGQIVPDGALKHEVSSRRPYAEWLNRQRLTLEALPQHAAQEDDEETLLPRLQAFGYTTEHLKFLLEPMVQNAVDPTGSMGNDTPLACLSDRPRLLYDYFKQLFAQVTNPPIDSIRESLVMSLACSVGPEGNLLESTEAQCHRLRLPRPVLTNQELASLQGREHAWRAATIDITCARSAGADGVRTALDDVCAKASAAIREGYRLIVLSDRAVGPERVPLSALLSVGAVHHHLIRTSERTKVGIIIETGEALEVHHFCLLVGYGADAINPYLAFEAIRWLRSTGILDTQHTDDRLQADYITTLSKGMLKVMAKMGISTLASYKGAQVFEAVGLHADVIDRCFAGTASRLSGVNFDILAIEALRRHEMGYPGTGSGAAAPLGNPGEFQWRANGERHAWNPETIARLQQAARLDSRDAYARFAKVAHESVHSCNSIRGLLRFRTGQSIPLEDVEPAAAIVKRFCTGAMSFGALSPEAHETLAVAMNRAGGKSNSGEGGEDPARYALLENGDSRRSAIKQVASGRFGVTIQYLTNADQIQIKIAQGAKPGEGGELPGSKVSDAIARVRHTTPGVMLISPPPHHDIYSIEDLAQLIHDLKNANPAAAVSVKLVAAVGVGAIAAGVAKARADHILISGHDGGTGASPLTSIRHAGLPWELGLAEAHQTLVLNDLRNRVRLEADGQFRTGRDVAMAALLGAEEFGFSTAPLIALGCIMMRKCHLNTCPVGICTQDPVLRRRFAGQPEHVLNYLFMVAEETRRIMARLGFAAMPDMIGRSDMLEPDPSVSHWKARSLDLSPLLVRALPVRPDQPVHCTTAQDHRLELALDHELIRACTDALDGGAPVSLDMPVHNTQRAVGTMLSHEIAKRHGEAGLPDGTIHVMLRGSAGQSFGAWLAGGVTLELEGDANDYVGKGLSGGRLIIYPPRAATFAAEENILIGNVVLYGAIRGEAFFRGVAGERFCVRNSGADAVVEGVGDHGCEYMTGGRVVILGRTGRNFAAGMSGGVAFVADAAGTLRERCNLGLVELERVSTLEDAAVLRRLIEQHLSHTGSVVAARLLGDWPNSVRQFAKVVPLTSARSRHRVEGDAAARERAGQSTADLIGASAAT